LTRLIQTERPYNERKKILVAIKLTLRDFEEKRALNQQTRDHAAFVCLALLTLSASIDSTVEPWEKRGYWVKADRFRNEWAWTGRLGVQLREAILQEKWDEILQINKCIAEKLVDIKAPLNNRFGSLWEGAWQKLE